MSNSQTDSELKEIEKAARMFKALSNPHRLRIYRALASCGGDAVISEPQDEFQNCQREFAEELGLAPSTVSHHFKELRHAGLIHMKREGKNVVVWVDEKIARVMLAFFSS
ncbi:MAG: helix-turn-helix transcriptional regulator [Desulfatibacillum sp.]|nr:helix-turn-helix transcriptional regulator [Desulfatibacillum sp.]